MAAAVKGRQSEWTDIGKEIKTAKGHQMIQCNRMKPNHLIRLFAVDVLMSGMEVMEIMENYERSSSIFLTLEFTISWEA